MENNEIQSFEQLSKLEDIRQRFRISTDRISKWNLIREAYKENFQRMENAFKISKTQWTDPYIVDWGPYFTPIEEFAWLVIRGIGCVVLYPQYPVLNFFIDFANPFLKVGLEVDGKKYHDYEEDKKRDERLSKLGWRIFRVSGSTCNKEYVDINDIVCMKKNDTQRNEQMDDFLNNTLEGIIYAICFVYFKRFRYITNSEMDTCLSSLSHHMLAGQNILLANTEKIYI